MRVVHRQAVRKARETERTRQHLHTLEHRLICLYTWRQQAKQGENPQKIRRTCTTSAPYLAASRPRSHAPAPLPPLHHRWRGGQGVRPATNLLGTTLEFYLALNPHANSKRPIIKSRIIPAEERDRACQARIVQKTEQLALMRTASQGRRT